MSFAETLSSLLQRIKGAEMVMICGADGMPVESVGTSSLISADDLSAESSQLLNDIMAAIKNLNLGTIGDVSISTEKCTVILRAITDEYYFAVCLKPGGNSGQARFLLRTTVARIAHEF